MAALSCCNNVSEYNSRKSLMSSSAALLRIWNSMRRASSPSILDHISTARACIFRASSSLQVSLLTFRTKCCNSTLLSFDQRSSAWSSRTPIPSLSQRCLRSIGRGSTATSSRVDRENSGKQVSTVSSTYLLMWAPANGCSGFHICNASGWPPICSTAVFRISSSISSPRIRMAASSLTSSRLTTSPISNFAGAREIKITLCPLLCRVANNFSTPELCLSCTSCTSSKTRISCPQRLFNKLANAFGSSGTSAPSINRRPMLFASSNDVTRTHLVEVFLSAKIDARCLANTVLPIPGIPTRVKESYSASRIFSIISSLPLSSVDSGYSPLSLPLRGVSSLDSSGRSSRTLRPSSVMW